jgi:hypothetical protein
MRVLFMISMCDSSGLKTYVFCMLLSSEVYAVTGASVTKAATLSKSGQACFTTCWK